MRHALLLATAIAALPAAAQVPLAVDAAADEALLPDIEFAADVQMQSVTFGEAPRAGVTFHGGPGLRTRHDVERDGLDRPVAAGRTYRNATVRTTISATLTGLSDVQADTARDATPAAPSAPAPPDEDTP